MNRTLTNIFWATYALLLTPALSWALSVTPTYQMFELKGGEKTTGQLTLTNNEEGDLVVTPSIRNFYSIPANKKIKTGDWLKIDTKPFVLKKGESQTLSFTVIAPKKAQGELAGNLHFGTESSDVKMVSLHLSLAIYLAIRGTEKPGLEVMGLSLQLSSHTEVAVALNNKGNIHLRPRVLVQIYNPEDTLLVNAYLNYGQPALPGQPRIYTGTVKDYRLPEGKYYAQISIEDTERGIPFPSEKKKFQVTKDGRLESR